MNMARLLDFAVRHGFSESAEFHFERTLASLRQINQQSHHQEWMRSIVQACVQLKWHTRLISLWREFPLEWSHVANAEIWLHLARALIHQGRWTEAERVLTMEHCDNQHDNEDINAAWHCWMGIICIQTHRQQKAIDYFKEALRLNPFLVEAAEALAKYGNQFVVLDTLVSDEACLRWLDVGNQKESSSKRRPVSTPLVGNQQNTLISGQQQNTAISGQHKQNSAGISVSVPLVRDKKRTRSGDTKRSTSGSSLSQGPLQTMGQHKHTHGEVAAEVVVPVKRQDHLHELVPGFTFASLRRCYRIMQLLHQFKLKECIQLIHCHDGVIPYAHWNTPWFHARLARAYFEDLEYELAARHFKRVRELEQSPGVCVVRVRDMDLYSTALWHLKDQVTLSALAQEMIRGAPGAVETWSVLGNCWSLMKEHENASRCFQRAQVLAGGGYMDDAGLVIPAVGQDRVSGGGGTTTGYQGDIQSHHAGAYACNLSGSEYMANEAYEKALLNYRHAIRMDPSMYNAWFGMGVIYYKQEKWELAEFHFRKALSIHRSSTILQCYVGMVLHKMKKYEEALLFFDRAIQLNQKNPQVHYRKALCLMDLQRLDESLREFHQVILLAPRETRVYFTMGKAYQQLGRTGDALKMYLQAMEVDMKMSTHVREAIDSLHLVDGEAVNDIYRAFA